MICRAYFYNSAANAQLILLDARSLFALACAVDWGPCWRLQMQRDNQPQPAGDSGSVHYGFVVLGTVVLVVFSALGLARFGYTSLIWQASSPMPQARLRQRFSPLASPPWPWAPAGRSRCGADWVNAAG